MKRYLTLLVVASLALSCKENTVYELNVPPTVDVTAGANIAFKAVGGSGTIEVAPVEESLQVKTAQSDWCHLSVSGNRIDVVVDPYDGLESRYAIVEMTAGRATGKTIVHQFGVIVKNYSWKDVTVKNGSQTIVFPYDADGSTVVAESDQDWLSFDATPEALSIHVAANPSTDYREALVRWSVGSVSGEITVGQFDLGAAGLLGEWDWHGKQSSNNRDFPMQATLSETSEGVYALSLDYSTSTIEIALEVDGLVLQANKLMLPLGGYAGTYSMKRTGLVYHAFPVVVGGLSRILYKEAVTEGFVPFILEKDEEGHWTATCDMSAYPEQLFRFEMWANVDDIEYDDEEDPVYSESGLILYDIYMDKI